MATTSKFPPPRRSGPEDVLPSGEALLSAIRGHHVGEHPLVKLAHELGALHHRELTEIGSDCHDGKAELVIALDIWVAEHLPTPHPDATVHSETLGAVIDRLADAQVRAYHLLMAVAPGDQAVRTAWHRLAELVDDYTDLITALAQRSRRLPVRGDSR